MPPSIKDVLPHNGSFLLVDEAEFVDDATMLGQFHIKLDNPIFKEHIPSKNIYPGVLILEGGAQTAWYLLSCRYSDKEEFGAIMTKINNAVFMDIVAPDDTLLYYARLVKSLGRRIFKFNITVKKLPPNSDKELVCSAFELEIMRTTG